MMWAGPGGPVTDDFAKQSLKEDCLVWSSLPLWAATSSLDLEIPTSSAMMVKTFSELQAESIMSLCVRKRQAKANS